MKHVNEFRFARLQVLVNRAAALFRSAIDAEVASPTLAQFRDWMVAADGCEQPVPDDLKREAFRRMPSGEPQPEDVVEVFRRSQVQAAKTCAIPREMLAECAARDHVPMPQPFLYRRALEWSGPAQVMASEPTEDVCDVSLAKHMLAVAKVQALELHLRELDAVVDEHQDEADAGNVADVHDLLQRYQALRTVQRGRAAKANPVRAGEHRDGPDLLADNLRLEQEIITAGDELFELLGYLMREYVLGRLPPDTRSRVAAMAVAHGVFGGSVEPATVESLTVEQPGGKVQHFGKGTLELRAAGPAQGHIEGERIYDMAGKFEVPVVAGPTRGDPLAGLTERVQRKRAQCVEYLSAVALRRDGDVRVVDYGTDATKVYCGAGLVGTVDDDGRPVPVGFTPSPPKLRVWQLTDSELWAGETLEQARADYAAEVGEDCRADLDDPIELTERDMRNTDTTYPDGEPSGRTVWDHLQGMSGPGLVAGVEL